MSTMDVVVVGGGPAGSTVAGLLAKAGLSVTLLDRTRFPREKPCGECLNPGAVGALRRLGLIDAVEALRPTRLAGWRLQAPGIELGAGFGGDQHGLGVSRLSLDAALLQRARERGVAVVEGARAEHAVAGVASSERPSLVVRYPDGEVRALRPRLLIGADGLRSRVARALGLIRRPPKTSRVSFTFHLQGHNRPEGEGTLDVRDGITLGLAPLQDGLWNATLVGPAGAWAQATAADGPGALREILTARIPATAAWPVVGGPWVSGPFDQPVTRAWAEGVLLVGDAAGYFDPFTGQGIYRALRSAELASAAATAFLEARRSANRALARYHGLWRREIRTARWVQHGVDQVMAHPRLRRMVLGRLKASGGLHRVIRVTGDVAPATSLLHPSVWGGTPAAHGRTDSNKETAHADHR